MGDRALAHVEKILNIYPIDGADKVEMVQVLDFHVLTGKGQFNPGDLVVYVECDSILPDGLSDLDKLRYTDKRAKIKKASEDEIEALEAELKEIILRNTRPEYEFLRRDKFIIKAKKYNKLGIISMGIIFPLSVLPKNVKPKEGLDVTDILGIEKVIEDPEEDTRSTKNKNGIHKYFMGFSFYRNLYSLLKKDSGLTGVWQPFFPSKSDEINAQNVYSKMLSKYGDQEFYVAEKMEGQNISAFIYDKKKKITSKSIFGVCSRSVYYKNDIGNPFWRSAKVYNFEKKLRLHGKNVFIRGEHCGVGIQKNIYSFGKTRIFLFEVFDIDEQRYLNFEEFIAFCEKYEFETVPILDSSFKLLPTIQEILNYSNGISVHGNKVKREGIVIRLKSNPRVSFKVKSPEYLVKKK
jgi:hypothetical protein